MQGLGPPSIGNPNGGILKHSTVILRGLRGALNLVPTMLRDASLSDSYIVCSLLFSSNFFHSKGGIGRGGGRVGRGRGGFGASFIGSKFIDANSLIYFQSRTDKSLRPTRTHGRCEGRGIERDREGWGGNKKGWGRMGENKQGIGRKYAVNRQEQAGNKKE